MNQSDKILRENVYKDYKKYFGVEDAEYIESVINTWGNPSAMDFLWSEIEMEQYHLGRILDMAAGVGTFVLRGLLKGYDAYGIEPEEWKLVYFRTKVIELGLPRHYKGRIIGAVGEHLPFKDGSFDYIMSWQTLEHVQDFKKCISEMVRVLKPGGRLRIRCPDYRGSFYDPHYRLPFLPNMNRGLAKTYLKILGRPTLGLHTLQWITKRQIINFLEKIPGLEVIDVAELSFRRLVDKAMKRYKLPKFIAKLLADLYINRRVYTFKVEKETNLVVIKRF